MKRVTKVEMDLDQLLYYPTTVPSISSTAHVFSTSKVVLSGDNPRLEFFWQKALSNIVGWRITKVMVENPAFFGDSNLFYNVTSNLPSPSPNEGRVNANIRQLIGTLFRPEPVGPTNTIYNFTHDPTTWVRVKNYLEIDNIWVELLDQNGSTFPPGANTRWVVELEFLSSIQAS